jgi:hypothetical protein
MAAMDMAGASDSRSRSSAVIENRKRPTCRAVVKVLSDPRLLTLAGAFYAANGGI